jgi:integrase
MLPFVARFSENERIVASLRKRILPSGEVRWLVDYRDSGGKRRAKQFETKRDADAYMVKARAEVAAGVHVADSQSVTLGEAADLWVAAGERDRLEATTIRQRQQHVDLHIKPLIGTSRLSRLNAPMVQEFVDRLVETRSRAMSRRVVTSLKGILANAQRRGLIAHNPALVAKVAKRRDEAEESDSVQLPPKAHLKRMITKSAELWPMSKKNSRGEILTCCWRPLILTAIFTGMRASELRGLTWENVDFETGQISVRQRADRYNRLGMPKSKAGRRDIPMAPLVANTLREWKLACPTTSLDLVFPSERGAILWHTNLYTQCFLRLLDACGLMIVVPVELGKELCMQPPYNFHALRHAAASLFIEQGWTPKKVQTIMGHSSIQVTFDIYGHLFPSPDDDVEAMAQIEARLLT